MKKLLMIFVIIVFAFTLRAQVISLNGNWSFAIDPLNRGELSDWHKPWKTNDANLLVQGFDKVTVPHTWSNDNRYNFIGKAWYFKALKLPDEAKDKTFRLSFDGVYYKCRIFVNGELAGYHYGGYTPFKLDISALVKAGENNFIAVEVDNSWSEFTIPGGRLGNHPNQQLFPWYEYGGITRDVNLIVTNKVYISNQKIESYPELSKGTARLILATWIENKTYEPVSVSLESVVKNRTTGQLINSNFRKSIVIPAYSSKKVVVEGALNAEDVLLWDFDNPNLYDVTTTVASESTVLNEYKAYFGIREFKVNPDNATLELNGNPIRVMGANRHSDHPVYGSIDPKEIAEVDMAFQRNGNMIFARLNHTPTSKYFYQWADENGYLIIAEIPNWQISPKLMANALVREEFTRQMTEMVEAYWNSPSIVAYSTGNEYASWTPEGDEWTRFQMEQYSRLDTTRLLTFVALGGAGSPGNLKPPHDSFRYCDFININNYSSSENLASCLKRLHAKYPNKPIFLSEFGKRADQVKNEDERIEHLKEVVEIFKQQPYVVGGSYWSFNDYKSRFTGTNENGYREWGIIDFNRKPRGLYKAFQKELSPVAVVRNGSLVTVIAKSDFPSYTLSNYKLKVMDGTKEIKSYDLPDLAPGEKFELSNLKISLKSGIVIENSKGFKVYDSAL